MQSPLNHNPDYTDFLFQFYLLFIFLLPETPRPHPHQALTFAHYMELTTKLVLVGGALRVLFFAYGLFQDAYLSLKYTDIDYLVFTDAARYVAHGDLPYARATYRYTPLLAWMLVPTAWGGWWVHFGKLVFMAGDLLTGCWMARTLPRKKALLAALWLCNPMVIAISTRGSSESVLTLLVMCSVAALRRGRHVLLALWLGTAVHFKLYPVIYLPAIMLGLLVGRPGWACLRRVPVLCWLNGVNVAYAGVTVLAAVLWSAAMYAVYGYEFLDHSFVYHVVRLDHRHNFLLYNVALYYKLARPFVDSGSRDLAAAAAAAVARHNLPRLARWLQAAAGSRWAAQFAACAVNLERIAFVPQLLLSAVVLPLRLARTDLEACLFVQTFAFVAFNKVMTSQYFIWFLIFLPHYVARSLLATTHRQKGYFLVALWVATQLMWLYSAYRLEFLGHSVFDTWLLASAVAFFLANCYMIGQFIRHFSAGTEKEIKRETIKKEPGKEPEEEPFGVPAEKLT